MFRVIDIGGIASVVGVDWFALTGTARERSKQRASHIKLMEATHKIDVADADASLIGLLSADNSDFPSVTYSAAAWFAHAAAENNFNTVVLVKKLDKDNFWLCAASNGLPVVRGDRIVSRQTLGNAIDDVLGRSDNIQLLIDASEQEANELAELLAHFGEWGRVNIEDYIGEVEPVAKVASTGVSSFAIFGVAGGILFIVLAVIAYWIYSSNEEERLRLAALAAQAQQTVSPDDLYISLFKKYFSTQPRFVARDLLLSMWEQVRALNMNEQGWSFKSYECVATKGVCTIEYARTAFAGDIEFDAQKYFAVAKDIDSVKAVRKIELETLRLHEPLNSNSFLAQFNSDGVVAAALPVFRAATDLSLTANFGQQTPVSAIVAPGASIQAFEGHWSLGGNMALFDVVKQLPSTLMLDGARFDLTAHGLEFKAGGTYWIAVKSGPAPASLSSNP